MKMDNRKTVKMLLLICLSIILLLTITLSIILITELLATKADHKLDDSKRTVLGLLCGFGAIEVVIQVLGIVVISRHHSCGFLLIVEYHVVSLILVVVFSIIAAFSIQSIFALLLKITIIAVWVFYGHKLRPYQTNNF